MSLTAVCRDVTPCSFVKGAKPRMLKLGSGEGPESPSPPSPTPCQSHACSRHVFQCVCLNACCLLCLSLTAKCTMSSTFAFRFCKFCKQTKCVVATYPAHHSLPHFTTPTTPTDLCKSHSSSSCNAHPSYIPSLL